MEAQEKIFTPLTQENISSKEEQAMIQSWRDKISGLKHLPCMPEDLSSVSEAI